MENEYIKLYGYIKLCRSIDNWGWRTNPNTLSVFLYCLTHARHTPGEYHGVQLQPGQLITGRDAISRGTGITTQSVRTALKNLQKTGEITIKATNKFSIVTVVNWAKFQYEPPKSNQQPNQQPTNNQPADNQQLTTNNNDNNGTMEDVVGGSISSTLLQAVMDVWENPSKSLVSGVEKLAEEHGEASVIDALKTAVEHDTEGGVSLAYVKAILSNPQPQQEQPEYRIEKYWTAVNGEFVEAERRIPVERQQPRTRTERYNIVKNGKLIECTREVPVRTRKEVYTVVVNGVEHERVREVPI